MVLSGKRPWARQLWLTANKDRQEKSRQPRRAKSDKPPGLPERVRWVMLVQRCSPDLMRKKRWLLHGRHGLPSIELSISRLHGKSPQRSRRNRKGEEKAELKSGFNFYARSPSGMANQVLFVIAKGYSGNEGREGERLGKKKKVTRNGLEEETKQSKNESPALPSLKIVRSANDHGSSLLLSLSLSHSLLTKTKL
ncbi:hypothetical protein ASPTUDRAFT_32297 [Aspergillus tubingensis CBS 134.48]|uniref:Uncharacterized protein n=1 Tax=Aspergillus tubingensis (strain CBS 134.48) TaxID=767770 RepID=A0A1L9MVB0_ASPTC|nr:hypothetical protein ASPTUDRAFT_32297 [Aspergillus tubingensis CBS 134.48]